MKATSKLFVCGRKHMRSNHRGKRVVAVILLIFTILMLPLTALTCILAFSEELTTILTNYLIQLAEAMGQDPGTTEIASYPPDSAISMLILNGVIFLISVFLFSISSRKAMLKMHDYYGLRREGFLRYRFAVPFIIIGVLGMIAAIFIRNNQTIFYIVISVASGFIIIGMLALIPVPASFGVKRRYHGNKATFTYPRSRIMKGFNPNQITAELCTLSYTGYNCFEKIEILNQDSSGARVRVTMSSNLSPQELREKKKEHYKLAKKALRHNEYIVPNFDYDVTEKAGRTYSETNTLKATVNDYDIVTTYGNGSRSVEHHYKDVVTGHEIVFKKSIFYRYDYYLIPNSADTSKLYVQDMKGHALGFVVYGGTKIVGRQRK